MKTFGTVLLLFVALSDEALSLQCYECFWQSDTGRGTGSSGSSACFKPRQSNGSSILKEHCRDGEVCRTQTSAKPGSHVIQRLSRGCQPYCESNCEDDTWLGNPVTICSYCCSENFCNYNGAGAVTFDLAAMSVLAILAPMILNL